MEFETVKKIACRKPSIQLEEFNFRETNRGHSPQRAEEKVDCLSQLPIFQPAFNCIPEITNEDTLRDEVVKKNDWTRTFKNLLDNKEDNLNVSISDGQEIKSSYLSDVKLEKLDGLSRQMVVSMLTENSQK